jgi:hypothetical protein
MNGNYDWMIEMFLKFAHENNLCIEDARFSYGVEEVTVYWDNGIEYSVRYDDEDKHTTYSE